MTRPGLLKVSTAELRWGKITGTVFHTDTDTDYKK